MDGVTLICDERERQKTRWTEQHDDGHSEEDLAALAAYLVVPESDTGACILMKPWAAEYADHIAEKYPNDRIRQLVIAGALIAAEIDRLRRMTANQTGK